MFSPVPGFTRSLKALSATLAKAEAHATAKKIDPAVLVNARLYPDMLPLVRQVLIACDHAKGCIARLSGNEVPSYADDEASFVDLQARIAKTLAFIATIPASAFEGAETRPVTIKVGGKDMTMPGAEYYTSRAIPNFYFHMTVTHAILRQSGVEVGKGDFIGS